MGTHDEPVSVREAEGDIGTEEFWRRLRQYYAADILPDPDDPLRARFLGQERRDWIQRVHDRPADRARYLIFVQGGRAVGLALAVVFDSEDGKCLIMEFCVYPEFRGGGLGHRCARALLDWARLHGAAYAELNYGGDGRRLRFWKSLGFVPNGADQWGDPTLILPPWDEAPFAVEALSDPEDHWQLLKLRNGLLLEGGRPPMGEAEAQTLQQALSEGRVSYLVAKRGCRAVGMRSLPAPGWTAEVFIEPAFRGRGVEEILAEAALRPRRAQGPKERQTKATARTKAETRTRAET